MNNNKSKSNCYSCPICKKNYDSSKQLKIHHSYCKLKKLSHPTNTTNGSQNNEKLMQSMLLEDDQLVNIYQDTPSHDVLSNTERQHKRQKEDTMN